MSCELSVDVTPRPLYRVERRVVVVLVEKDVLVVAVAVVLGEEVGAGCVGFAREHRRRAEEAHVERGHEAFRERTRVQHQGV